MITITFITFTLNWKIDCTVSAREWEEREKEGEKERKRRVGETIHDAAIGQKCGVSVCWSLQYVTLVA